MQFVYDEKAGANYLNIEDENYKYLFRVRRHNVGESINFRNLKDDKLYTYEVESISKKDASLKLISEIIDEQVQKKSLVLGWLVIDTKVIEKTLPFLNELGVEKICFIYGDYSQKNFKINTERFEKILINSCMQCGRTKLMEFELYNNLKEYKNKYQNSYAFNFSSNYIEDKTSEITNIVSGCEGGFSKKELELFGDSEIVGINTSNILRSETAAICIASKLL